MPARKNQESAKGPERLFLIDSMSHIFRAFFAPLTGRSEPLATSGGQLTQAVFIFTNMLRKLLTEEEPEYIAAIFESGITTFRQESFAAYKANRVEMPGDLQAQIPLIKRVCEVHHVPMINVPGYEADDVIGSLALQAASRNVQAVIVSNDKDMCQVVRDPWIICMRQNSQIVKRKEPAPAVEWCDEAWVRNKFGVAPAQVVDLLGLMGDSVDNIPGAPGIGSKGALQLVQQFGSIEKALEGWEQVKHKRYRESLQGNSDLIRQSRDLATIKTDLDLELDLEALRTRPADRGQAYQLFRELEFQNLTREFADGTATLVSERPEKRYVSLRNAAELETLIASLWQADNWGFALQDGAPVGAGQQQGGVREEQPSGIAISMAANSASYVDFETFEGGRERALEMLRDVLSNGLVSKCVHDSKRAVALAANAGLELEGVNDDTLLAAYLLDPVRSRYDLADLMHEITGAEGWTSISGDGWSASQWHAAEAADYTAQTAQILRSRIRQQGLETIYRRIEMPLAPVLHRMEKAGMRLDSGALEELSRFFGGELERLTFQISKLAGRDFNISSPKQVGEIFSELNISSGRKTATGQVSTSRAVLEELALVYELPRLIIEYREIEKLKTVYADALPSQIGQDGRLHGQLNQTVAATGRLSSSDPNLQNIPIRTEMGRRIRKAFVPATGSVLIAADYSQLELRLLAHITGDPTMLEAFQKGEDIHSRTAQLVFGAESSNELKEKRRFAKIVNFAIAYSVEPFGLSQRVGISVKEAKKVITDYYATYKGVRRYMEEIPERARRYGVVRSIYGRLRPVPGVLDRNRVIRGRAEREAINMPIQGTASDVVKIAMLRVDEALSKHGSKARMIMQIHDELLIEAPREEAGELSALVRREMESAVELDVPLEAEADHGDNWADAKR